MAVDPITAEEQEIANAVTPDAPADNSSGGAITEDAPYDVDTALGLLGDSKNLGGNTAIGDATAQTDEMSDAEKDEKSAEIEAEADIEKDALAIEPGGAGGGEPAEVENESEVEEEVAIATEIMAPTIEPVDALVIDKTIAIEPSTPAKGMPFEFSADGLSPAPDLKGLSGAALDLAVTSLARNPKELAAALETLSPDQLCSLSDSARITACSALQADALLNPYSQAAVELGRMDYIALQGELDSVQSVTGMAQGLGATMVAVAQGVNVATDYQALTTGLAVQGGIGGAELGGIAVAAAVPNLQPDQGMGGASIV